MSKLEHALCIATLSLGLVAGCSHPFHYAYAPVGPKGASKGASVAVKMVDARPEDHGGKEKNVVGQRRGGYGIPHAIEDTDPQVAEHAVHDMTVDALGRAGVAESQSGKTLVTTVNEFWMDGLVGFKATINVKYDLQDGGGKSLWSKTIVGEGGDSNMGGSNEGFYTIYQKALTDLATKASTEFASADFAAAAK